MNEIKIFSNNEFGEIRTVEKDNQIWFVAKDVCDCLDIGNSRQAITRLDEDEKADVILNDTSVNGVEQARSYSTVNEMGLYNLILRSDKPNAKQFKRWITHEVLPSIRKHGGYMQGQEQMTPDEIMARAVLYADSKIKELQGALGQANIKISTLKWIIKSYSQRLSILMS